MIWTIYLAVGVLAILAVGTKADQKVFGVMALGALALAIWPVSIAIYLVAEHRKRKLAAAAQPVEAKLVVKQPVNLDVNPALIAAIKKHGGAK